MARPDTEDSAVDIFEIQETKHEKKDAVPLDFRLINIDSITGREKQERNEEARVAVGILDSEEDERSALRFEELREELTRVEERNRKLEQEIKELKART